MKRFLRRLFASLSLVSLVLSTFTSCNTVGGVGEDLQILGEKMERKANQVSGGSRY